MANPKQNVNHVVTEIPPHDVAFDIEAFDTAIRSQGVSLVHYKAMRCPVGMTDLDDNQRPHPHHEGCSNGFIYTKAGSATCLFIGNSKNKRQDEIGFFDGSTVQVTLPRFYDDSEERIYVAPYDRFYLDEPTLVVGTWQVYLHHESGWDRLKYPVELVEELVDYRGERYYCGTDFEVAQGQIKWLDGRRPTPQLDVGPIPSSTRGAVMSVRYKYRPFLYCGQVLHELRVTQHQDFRTNERRIEQMPQSVMLHREYVPMNKNQDNQEIENPCDADALRKVLGPGLGGFGPR